MAKVSFDNNKKVTQDLPVKTVKEYKDLVLCTIDSIEVTEKVSEAKTGYQFAGFNVPNLVIRFKQVVNAFNKDDRYFTLAFKPVVSIKNDGTKMSEDTFHNLVMGQFDHLKHILDSVEGTANYAKLGKLVAIDSDVETEDLLSDTKKFYETFAKAYAGKDGNGAFTGLEMIVKFIVNKGEKRLATPNFVNKGYIQIAKFDKSGKINTTLELYGESVVIPEAVVAGGVAAGVPGMAAAPVQQVNLGEI